MMPASVFAIVKVGESSPDPEGVVATAASPTIQHLHQPGAGHHDVGRLEIAMRDTLFMRRFQRLGDLQRDPQRLVQRLWRFQRRAIHQFHGDGFALGRLLQSVDGGDVRMIQRRQRLGFPVEARQTFGIARQSGGHHLDGDLAVEPRILSAIHLAHAARAQRRQNRIGPQPDPGRQRHDVFTDSSLLSARVSVRPVGQASACSGLQIARRLFQPQPAATRCILNSPQ